jgi:hypothetical protein
MNVYVCVCTYSSGSVFNLSTFVAVTYCINCFVWFSYGGSPVDYPDPQSDWTEFEAVLADKNDNPAEYPVSVKDPNEHPIRSRPWVDVAEVARVLEI